MIVDISGTRLTWTTITEWCALVMEEGSKLSPSSEHYSRLASLYRSLTIDRIKRSREAAGLHRATRRSDLGRHNPIPAHNGLVSVPTRAEMGATLVEFRVAAQNGDRPDAKSSAFPTHISLRHERRMMLE